MRKIFKSNQSGAINRLWFLAGFAVFLFISFGLTKEIVNRRRINNQISDYIKQADELKKENIILNDKIDNWRASGELEYNARVKLGLEKPGEQTIIINRENERSTGSTAIKTDQAVINIHGVSDVIYSDSRSNTEKWWDYFFKKDN